ncbi:MAG: transglutaminase family protein [Acidimicrobiia bacterium]
MSASRTAGPAVCLVGLTAAVAVAASLTGEVTLWSVTVPGPAMAAMFAAGAGCSARRWRPGRARRSPLNLAVVGAVLLAVVLTRATVDASDAAGGLHPLAEVFVLVLVLRSTTLTDPDRARAALLVSLGAVTGAAAEAPLADSAGHLVLWLAAALATLVGANGLSGPDRLGTPVTRPSRSAGWGRRAVEAGLIGLVVMVVAAGVLVVNPEPGRTDPRRGEEPGRRTAAPYLGVDDRLDTAVRGEPGNEVVLRVKAPGPDFWRGQTFDRWDGRAWARSALLQSSYPEAGVGSISPGIGDVEAGGETFVQEYTVVAPYIQALFGANRIDQVDTPVGALVAHGDGTVELRRPLGRGARYTVVSLRQRVTEASLRARGHDPLRTALPPFVTRPYLQLPTVPERVTALAAAVTGPAATTYDKVRALEAWLGANTVYTRDIPPLPTGADAVEQFLFEDRRGYCEQIASALAVMLRSVGVPTRVAAGYVPGDASAVGGEYTSRAGDAHAWVEVFFPGVGWQAFDPTASVPLSGETSTTALRRAADLLARLAPWLAVVAGSAAVAVLALVATREILRRRRRRSRPWAARCLERLEDAGAQRGRPRHPPETPAEYVAALAGSVMPDDRLVAVGAVVTRQAYGAAGDGDPGTVWAEQVLADIESRFPAHRRAMAGRRRRDTPT